MIRATSALLLTAALPALAGPIGYAQATGYYKKESRPTLYQPLNLLDGRDNTAWCSPSADPLNDRLTFGFKTSEKIDEIRISTGNNFTQDTWNTFARARKFDLKSPTATKTFEVLDQRGLQTIAIDPPMETMRFTLEVLDQFPADDPDAVVCITDVIFLSSGKALNGSHLGAKLKYDKHIAAVMGTWFSGYDEKPDRFLSFFFDGTFRYSYEPFDTSVNQPKNVTGEFDVSPGRMTLSIGKARKTAKMALAPESKHKRGGLTLQLEGELPEDLKQPFRSVP